MCLIIFAHRAHPGYPFLLAANRDEFHARPTAPSGFWRGQPELLAGRDLQAGGTWMGLTRDGRFAAVTNFRDPDRSEAAPASRGELPLAWLNGHESDPMACLQAIAARGDQYAGFNLLIGNARGLWYYSNAGQQRQPCALAPGVYGLSNASLDTPWPKVVLGKARMQAVLEGEVSHARLQHTVSDRALAPDSAQLPGDMEASMERLLSAQFIRSERYGTRSTTTLWRDGQGVSHWCERSFDAAGELTGVVSEAFPAP